MEGCFLKECGIGLLGYTRKLQRYIKGSDTSQWHLGIFTFLCIWTLKAIVLKKTLTKKRTEEKLFLSQLAKLPKNTNERQTFMKTYTIYNLAKIPSRPMRNNRTIANNQSTESRLLMIDWLIAYYFCPVREYFTHIKSQHFRWMVGLKSISILYSSGTNCSKLWSYQAKESSLCDPQTGWLSLPDPLIPLAKRLRFNFGQSHVRVRLRQGFCSAYDI